MVFNVHLAAVIASKRLERDSNVKTNNREQCCGDNDCEKIKNIVRGDDSYIDSLQMGRFYVLNRSSIQLPLNGRVYESILHAPK